MTVTPSLPLHHSFPPVIAQTSRLLVLGTMPGQRSLDAGEYYAHPRNAFWRLMEDILGVPAALHYAERLERLTASGLALWDVLASCERTGSLDTAIRSAQPNDFEALLSRFPRVEAVAFNGSKSAQLWKRHVGSCPARLALHALPSSSPANARMKYEAKCHAWADVISRSGIAVEVKT